MQALNLIFFYGKDGAGKDTQALKMVDEHPDWKIISTGDLDHPNEAIFTAFIAREIEKGTTTILSTGFPRTPSQLRKLDFYLGMLRAQRPVIDQHVFLDVEDQTILDRVDKRRRAYEARGLPLRSDDNPATALRRIQTFNADTLPVVNHLMIDGRIPYRISAEGTPDEVNNLVKGVLEHRPALGIKLPEDWTPPLGREREESY